MSQLPEQESDSADRLAILPPTDAAPQVENLDEARVFPCPACGADLTFHIGAQRLRCNFCGHEQTISFDDEAGIAEHDYRTLLDRILQLRRAAGNTREQDIREVACNACGATTRFTGMLTGGACAYCGIAIQVEAAHQAEDRVPVDGLLPFAIGHAAAAKNLADWVRSRWFAPNEFTSRGVEGRFDGVYLPFWTFDALTFTRYAGQRGDAYYVTVGSGKNRRSVRRVRWRPASGAFQRFFDDLLIVASQGVPKDRLERLEPWPLGNCVPFNQEMLAGFQAMTYDLQPDAGFEQARGLIDEHLTADVRTRIGGDEQRIHSIQTRYDAVAIKHLLLPVWMLTYRYRDKGYQVVINAQTGEVQGDRPYSALKIALFSLAALAVIATVAWFASQQ